MKSFASPPALCASGVAALVIASPAEFHLEALRAGVEAGLPTLCEKPLVHEDHIKEGAEVIEVYSRRDVAESSGFSLHAGVAAKAGEWSCPASVDGCGLGI